MKSMVIAPAIAAGVFLVASAGFGAQPAKADMLVSGGSPTVCATVYNNRLQLNKCNGGDAQNWFGYLLSERSTQQHYHNLCLDSETPNRGAQLVVTTCQNKPSQRWQLKNNAVYENDSGWCMDLNGGYYSEGTRIQIWTCGSQHNQLWAPGSLQSPNALRLSSAAMRLGAGSVFGLRWGQTTASSSLIAANAGNMLTARGLSGIVAQGGGNIVAQGGGNIVAQGGGNFVQLNGGMIVAQGGGN